MKILHEIKHEEAKGRLIEVAFIGFQMGAGGNNTFGQYLESLGLSEKKVEVANITKEEAIAKAERIRKAIRDNRK